MEQERFWELIEQAHDAGQGAVPRMRPVLARMLSDMDDETLLGFADQWAVAYQRADVWPLIEALNVAFGQISDDSYADTRDWLICQGEASFEGVLNDPDSIADYVGPEGETYFGEADSFHSMVWQAARERGAAREFPTLGLISGQRSDLSDVDGIREKYPRCAAARARRMTTPLPSIPIPTQASVETPRRTLLLGSTWTPRGGPTG